MSETISDQQAARILFDLLQRCDQSNSTITFREKVQDVIDLIDLGKADEAVRILNWITSHVSGQVHACEHEHAHWLQADEDQTQAYHVLDDLRFRWGYQEHRVVGNNIIVLGGSQ